MRGGASVALPLWTLLAAASGSVYTPESTGHAKILEIEILPEPGDDDGASVVADLQQLVGTDAGRARLEQHGMLKLLSKEVVLEDAATSSGGPIDFSSAVRLPEAELAKKVERLRGYKHLREMGAVDDARVVRDALVAAGGNVPRAAIELRKAAETQRADESADEDHQEDDSCWSHCSPTGPTASAWADATTRDCFLQCYSGAVPPLVERVELEIEVLPGVGADDIDAEQIAERLERLKQTEDGQTQIAACLTSAAASKAPEGRRSGLMLVACGLMLLTIAQFTGVVLPSVRTAKPPPSPSVVDSLERLVALKVSAELSADEFLAAKRALLDLDGAGAAETKAKSVNVDGTACHRRNTSAAQQQQQLRMKRAISWDPSTSRTDGWIRDGRGDDGGSTGQQQQHHALPRRGNSHDDEAVASVDVLSQHRRWCAL